MNSTQIKLILEYYHQEKLAHHLIPVAEAIIESRPYAELLEVAREEQKDMINEEELKIVSVQVVKEKHDEALSITLSNGVEYRYHDVSTSARELERKVLKMMKYQRPIKIINWLSRNPINYWNSRDGETTKDYKLSQKRLSASKEEEKQEHIDEGFLEIGEWVKCPHCKDAFALQKDSRIHGVRGKPLSNDSGEN